MKNKFLIVTFLISVTIYSQEKKKLFQAEFAPFTIQCEKIGRLLIDKTIESKLSDWYEGIEPEEINLELIKFESEIDKSELDITYYLILMSENPLFYSFDFHNEQTKEQFGQLFVRFKDRENTLVDRVQFISKSKMDEIESENNSEFNDIPLSPLLPSEKKKKNGN